MNGGKLGFAFFWRGLLWICVVLVATAIGAPSGDPRAEFEEARRWYVRAASGDVAALREAVRRFEELTGRPNAEPRVWAYLGSCRLMEAGAAALPLRKLELCREGGAWLERAVATAPDDVEVRLVRALSLIHLPGFFNKRAVAQRDLAWVVERLHDAPDIPAELAAAAWWQVGLMHERQRNRRAARAAWEQAVRCAPLSRSGRLAAAQLGSEPQRSGSVAETRGHGKR
ncbi:MAG: hypothetical protein N3A53_00115 [Verrucomicrobiae bacterium]|nr:hypothetical protein [Verrucomicrobiae bacterium]